jgi:hypothetical protein
MNYGASEAQLELAVSELERQFLTHVERREYTMADAALAEMRKLNGVLAALRSLRFERMGEAEDVPF